MKKATIALLVLTLLLSVCIAGLSCFPIVGAEVYNGDNAFDDTDPLDDLQSMKGFDLGKYKEDDTEILFENFVEYCYSFRVNARGNYGLYLYVYNPQGLTFSTTGNSIQMATGYDENGNPNDYEKFDLKLCGFSESPMYHKRFYKFRILDHISKDGLTVEQRVSRNARKYDISGFELKEEGETLSKEYPVGATYVYSGFAKGYGEDTNAEDTLSAEISFLEICELNVQQDVLKTATSALGKGHHNQINTAYFSVPNRLFKQYGNLNSIKASWYEYRSSPIIMINDIVSGKSYYEKLKPYVGVLLPLPYEYTKEIGVSLRSYDSESKRFFYYNPRSYDPNSDLMMRLAWLFNISGTNGEISKSEIEKYINSYHYFDDYTEEIYIGNGRTVSSGLFSSLIDEGRKKGYNKKEISVENTQDLFMYQDTLNAWNKFWYNLFNPNVEEGAELVPILKLENKDLTWENAEFSKKFYVSEEGSSKIKAYANEASARGESTVLFRFAITDYFEKAITLIDNTQSGFPDINGVARMAYQTFFFSFDIIQLTFKKNGVFTVIPAVSSPIDVIAPIVPYDPSSILDKIMGIVVGIVVAILAIIFVVVVCKLLRGSFGLIGEGLEKDKDKKRKKK